jgi:hypothetical protein
MYTAIKDKDGPEAAKYFVAEHACLKNINLNSDVRHGDALQNLNSVCKI